MQQTHEPDDHVHTPADARDRTPPRHATPPYSKLGAELPSLVLADLLEVHINTAERWKAAAGARWTNYVATRASPS